MSSHTMDSSRSRGNMERDKQTRLARGGLSPPSKPVGRARDFIVSVDTGTLGAVVKPPPRRTVLMAILRHQVTWGATVVILPSGWSDAGRGRIRDSHAETDKIAIDAVTDRNKKGAGAMNERLAAAAKQEGKAERTAHAAQRWGEQPGTFQQEGAPLARRTRPK